MKTLVRIIFGWVLILNSVLALGETREAFLSKLKFDGKIMNYSYVAYDLSGALRESHQVDCKYYEYNGERLLKSVAINIHITGEFSNPGFKTTRSGQLDIHEVITECINREPKIPKNFNFPIEIEFPKVSTPAY